MTEVIKANWGWILLCVIVLIPMVQMVAALALRRTRRQMLTIVDDVMKSDLNAADKAWLRSEIDKSSGDHLLIVSVFAPFAILGAVALGLYDGMRATHQRERKSLTESVEEWADEMEQTRIKFDTMDARAIKRIYGTDPRDGNFWSDPRRREISRLGLTLETWSHPISAIWVVLCLALAAPLVGIGYLLSRSITPFVSNLWDPLRRPVLEVLRLHSAEAPSKC